MANSIFAPTAPPTWSVPAPLLTRTPTAPAPTPVSYRFDPGSRDFATDGAGRVLRSLPDETTVQWAAKAATTQQAAYPIYARSFGVGLEAALTAGLHPSIEAALQQGITAAVRTDRRVSDAVDFVFIWLTSDTVDLVYTLVLANGKKRRVQVTLP